MWFFLFSHSFFLSFSSPIQMVIRTGRKIRLFYHANCFTGTHDPRTQEGSSFHEHRMPAKTFQRQAPPEKGAGKWSVSDYHYRPNTFSSRLSFDDMEWEMRKAMGKKPTFAERKVKSWDEVTLPPLGSLLGSQRSLLGDKKENFSLPQIKSDPQQKK